MCVSLVKNKAFTRQNLPPKILSSPVFTYTVLHRLTILRQYGRDYSNIMEAKSFDMNLHNLVVT